MSILPLGIEEGDFELIQAAVRETERGRWFLDEFTRRVRAHDVDRIVAAIEVMGNRLAEGQASEREMRSQLETLMALLSAFVGAITPKKPDSLSDRSNSLHEGAAPQWHSGR